MLSNTKLKRAIRLRKLNGGAADEQSIRADHGGARAKSRAGWARTAAPTSGPSVAEPALTRLQALDALRGFFGAPEGASSDDIRMRLAEETANVACKEELAELDYEELLKVELAKGEAKLARHLEKQACGYLNASSAVQRSVDVQFASCIKARPKRRASVVHHNTSSSGDSS